MSGDSVRDPANLPSVNVSVNDRVSDVTLLDNIGKRADSVFSATGATSTIAQLFTVASGQGEYLLGYIQVDFASSSGVEVRVCAEDSAAGKVPGSDCSQYSGTMAPSAGLHTYELASEKILSPARAITWSYAVPPVV